MIKSPEFPKNKTDLSSREEEKENELKIISGILDNSADWKNLIATDSEKINEKIIDRWINIDLSYGSKSVGLDFMDVEGYVQASTYLDTESYPKLAGETTLLYKAVKSAVQQFCDSIDRPVLYRIITQVDKMKDWAMSLSHGREIFDWDDWEYDEKEKEYIFEKTFYPKNARQQ